jgi:phosphinothricin acetyltransferase
VADERVLTVRAGTEDDLDSMNDVYNHYIATSHATFDIKRIGLDARREWFSHYDTTGRYRVVVAIADDHLMGYASSSPYRPKQAYETSVETTVYVAPDVGREGIGTALYAALFDALDGEDIHRAYAGIALPNPASVRLHERFGFRCVGEFTEQGRKFGKYWDVAWYEKEL